ncbi:MAG: type II toxin-antitoxin system RelE/ParE family toxin [Gallionella sp.]|nr:type II toxin-antitoxin system RelE/ParE family toxin [Gallionella sp.]
MKPLVRHERADKDVLEAVEYYLQNAPEVTLAFIDVLEQTYRNIQHRPGAGSPRYAHELNLHGLRFWRCKRFPYLVFYVETADQINIWRVLHGSRDIPAWLSDEA